MVQTKKNEHLERFAYIVRILTAPSVLAVLLATVLFLEFREISFPDFLLLALFEGIIPILGYPICFFVPTLHKQGRDFERKAAFLCSIVGYTGGVIYGLCAQKGTILLTVYFSYFASVVVLTVVNKVFRIKASGHACGIFGPMLLTVLLCSPLFLIPCVCIVGLVIFSSLYLKRHTLSQLILGSLCAAVSVVVVWLIFKFLL